MDARAERQKSKLEYLRSMIGELRTVAKAERLDMAAYLLEMSYIEVCDIIRGERPLRESRGASKNTGMII